MGNVCVICDFFSLLTLHGPNSFVRRFRDVTIDRIFSSTDSQSRRSQEIFLMIPSKIEIESFAKRCHMGTLGGKGLTVRVNGTIIMHHARWPCERLLNMPRLNRVYALFSILLFGLVDEEPNPHCSPAGYNRLRVRLFVRNTCARRKVSSPGTTLVNEGKNLLSGTTKLLFDFFNIISIILENFRRYRCFG